MNYETATDFEINKAVAEALGAIPDRSILQNFPPSHALHLTTEGRLNGWSLDYCNSWADAGPIIENNGIAIAPVAESKWMAQFTIKTCPPFNDSRRFGYSYVEHRHTNPRRAAMIVFLKMQEKG